MGTSEKLREALADLEHDRWSRWMRYLFSKSAPRDSGAFIPAELYARWHRQTELPYTELSEVEKDSDRKEADNTLAVVARFVGGFVRQQDLLLGDLAKFIMAEVPGEPRPKASDEDGIDCAHVAVRVIREYQRAAHALWRLLDEVNGTDTLEEAHAVALQRAKFFVTDGADLFRVTEEGVVPAPEPRRGDR